MESRSRILLLTMLVLLFVVSGSCRMKDDPVLVEVVVEFGGDVSFAGEYVALRMFASGREEQDCMRDPEVPFSKANSVRRTYYASSEDYQLLVPKLDRVKEISATGALSSDVVSTTHIRYKPGDGEMREVSGNTAINLAKSPGAAELTEALRSIYERNCSE